MDPIEKRVTLNAPVSKVWEAITDPQELEKWMLMTTTFKAEKGTAFTFKTDPTEQWDGIFNCEVREVIPNRKLVFTWDTGFINAETIVTIELTERGNQTDLVLIHSGWEKMAANQEETKKSHSEGWDVRVYQKLKEVVEV